MIQTGVVRIGKDPELRTTAQGDQVMELSLAYNYGRKGDDNKKPTQWISASMWGSRAEKLQPYLKKGGQVFVVLTDVHMYSYEKKDGTIGTAMRAKVAEIELIGGAPQQSQELVQKPVKPATTGTGSFDDFDDDIPF
jgi:single-strand DNA-binding protein